MIAVVVLVVFVVVVVFVVAVVTMKLEHGDNDGDYDQRKKNSVVVQLAIADDVAVMMIRETWSRGGLMGQGFHGCEQMMMVSVSHQIL
jgi:hypothetical protein